MSTLMLAKLCDTNSVIGYLKDIQPMKKFPIYSLDINARILVSHLRSRNTYCCANTTCLSIAAQYSDSDTFDSLVHLGANVLYVDDRGDSILHKVIRSNIDQLDKIEVILKRQPGLLDRMNVSGLAPLHLSVFCENDEVFSELLSYGADINALTSVEMTSVLHIACYLGKNHLVKQMIEQTSIDLNLMDRNKNTALHIVNQQGNLEGVRILINSYKCLTYIRNGKGRTPEQVNPLNIRLHEESQHGSLKEIKRLVSKGAICITDPTGRTNMHMACRSAKDAYVKIEYLYNIWSLQTNLSDNTGYLPIHLIAATHYEDIMEFLIPKCDINCQTENRKLTPLHIAVHFSNKSMIDQLLESPRCDVNCQDLDGNTPAHFCAIQDKQEILCRIQHHPKYNELIKNRKGNTADEENHVCVTFQRMCLHGDAHYVRRMVSLGVRFIKDLDKNNVLHLVCKSYIDAFEKCKEIVQIKPELVGEHNNRREFPLHIACSNTDSRLLRYLLDFPDNGINALTIRWDSALHLSVIHARYEYVEILARHINTNINIQDIVGDTVCHVLAKKWALKEMRMIHAMPSCLLNVRNKEGLTSSDIFFSNTKWRLTLSVRVEFMYDNSFTLIKGHLVYGDKDFLVKVNLELETVWRVQHKGMGYVFQISELEDGGLVVAACNGLFHLTYEGNLVSRIAAGDYTSVVCHYGYVYAVQWNMLIVEVYHPSNAWQQTNTIPLRIPDDPWTMKLLVTDSAIFVSSSWYNVVYELTSEGIFVEQYGLLGERKEAGDLSLPRLCNVESDGALLVADYGNDRLQVLHANGHWSRIATPTLDGPCDAAYFEDRLYVLTKNGLHVLLPE